MVSLIWKVIMFLMILRTSAISSSRSSITGKIWVRFLGEYDWTEENLLSCLYFFEILSLKRPGFSYDFVWCFINWKESVPSGWFKSMFKYLALGFAFTVLSSFIVGSNERSRFDLGDTRGELLILTFRRFLLSWSEDGSNDFMRSLCKSWFS